MARRTKATQAALDQMNLMLAIGNVFLYTEDKKGYEYINVESYSDRVSTWKQGICEAIEIMLHRADCYKGYRELYPNDDSRRFDRQYY